MDACKQKLIDDIKDYSVDSRLKGGWQFRRFTVDAPAMDPIEWLNGQKTARRVYYSPSNSNVQVAGIGSAIDWSELPQIDEFTESGMPCFYTRSFDSDSGEVNSKWRGLESPLAFIPLIEYSSTGELSANLVCPPEADPLVERDELLDKLEGLMPPLPLSESGDTWSTREDRPDRAQWTQAVERVLQEITTQGLEKAVIARETEFTFNEPLSDLSVLRQLSMRSPDTNIFLVSNDAAVTFLGGTPELLFERSGRALSSHAVAATRLRGKSDDEDAALEEELMSTHKECREHGFVAEMLEECLNPLCEEVTRSPVTVMKLPRLQHLYSEISGTLRDGHSDQEIIGALHPTPAVGGVPRNVALPLIKELEPFSRGCYAAPFGIVQGNYSRFLVAIRSALIVGNHLYTYAGAGIVDGSEALAEWNEVESKIASIRGIFEE